MLQWFISFSEFTEFSESSAPFRKNSIETLNLMYFHKTQIVLHNNELEQQLIVSSPLLILLICWVQANKSVECLKWKAIHWI